MDNMIQGNVTRSNRPGDPVEGWDNYHKMAIKSALRYIRWWMPTHEDLVQAAALAATVAQHELGDRVEDPKKLYHVLRRVLRQQAAAYGLRQKRVYRPDGTWTMKEVRHEYTNSGLQTAADNRNPDGEDYDNFQEYQESRMMYVGIGEWSRKHTHFLHDLMR